MYHFNWNKFNCSVLPKFITIVMDYLIKYLDDAEDMRIVVMKSMIECCCKIISVLNKVSWVVFPPPQSKIERGIQQFTSQIASFRSLEFFYLSV